MSKVQRRISFEDEVESHPLTQSPTPLRVCCYGSSSSKTPQKYLTAAYDLGMTLAKRGHTCVNGAGHAGCMDAMNKGASDGDGRIVGVIHEMFVVDGSDCFEGSNSVFANGKHEILIAGGNDLQERKRMLVKGADAVVVLPGGPGTWDELWEMACAKQVGLMDIPIVCVSVDGYYEAFNNMLQRAHEDDLLYLEPNDIVHFESSPAEAVKWAELRVAELRTKKRQKTIKQRSSILKKLDSNVSGSIMSVWGRAFSFFSGNDEAGGCASTVGDDRLQGIWKARYSLAIFTFGVSVGVTLSSKICLQRA